jgi:signal transduction histidine kinase
MVNAISSTPDRLPPFERESGASGLPAAGPPPPAVGEALAEERDRIAGDLLDHVVNELFEVGLLLDGVNAHVVAPQGRRHLRRAVTRLDGAIIAIRTSVFELSPQRTRGQSPDPACATHEGPAPAGATED